MMIKASPVRRRTHLAALQQTASSELWCEAQAAVGARERCQLTIRSQLAANQVFRRPRLGWIPDTKI